MENVKLLNGHESVTSQESIEMEEYSDEEDEVFVKGKKIKLEPKRKRVYMIF